MKWIWLMVLAVVFSGCLVQTPWGAQDCLWQPGLKGGQVVCVPVQRMAMYGR